MKYFGEGLSEKHKELQSILYKKDKIEQSKELFLDIHAKLHLSEISQTNRNEIDDLLQDLESQEFGIMPTSKDETIAWVIWHIARIEDLTMNFLVAKRQQVFNELWQNEINVKITDTANALNDDGIMDLSKNINCKKLLEYRNEVGKRTREIVKSLKTEDMKRKVAAEDLQKIYKAGGVTFQEESYWLLDFWGKKDIGGILLMPPTRHEMLHLNDCVKWKQQIRTRKKFFRS